MTGPLVHLAEPGLRAACGQRATDWSTNDTGKVDCRRCVGTVRFTIRTLEEQGTKRPLYRELMRIHAKRVRDV